MGQSGSLSDITFNPEAEETSFKAMPTPAIDSSFLYNRPIPSEPQNQRRRTRSTLNSNDFALEEQRIDRQMNESAGRYGSKISPALASAMAKMDATNPVYSQARGPGQEDCSSYTCKIFKAVGKDIGGDTWAQRNWGKKLNPGSQLAGDLVHFNTGKNSRHVGIDLGNGTFKHMSSSGSPKISDYASYPFQVVQVNRGI